MGRQGQEKRRDRQGGEEEGLFVLAAPAVLPQLTTYQDLVSPMVGQVQ